MAKQAFEELGNVYVLNNNAGVGDPYGPDLLRLKEKYWDRLLNINLKGQWLVSKFVCKRMKKQDFEPIAGKVIHTASIAGMKVDNKNAISPGYHVTGIYNNSEEAMRMTMEDGHVKTPLNRLGTIEDVVNVSLFLASPLSDFITGHNIPVDGGIAEVGVPAWYIKSDV